MDLAVLEQLQAVLYRPQEPVGRGEAVGVRRGHVAAGGQGGQGGQGGRRPQGVVGPPVNELEQLHGELDVPDASSAQLYLPLGQAVAGYRLLGPGFHAPQGAQVVGAQRAAPNPAGRLEGEGLAQLRVAGDRPSLEQGLKFPRLRPPVPVRLVRGQATHEHAGAPFGAQVEVRPPRLAGQGQQGVGVARTDQHDVDVTAVIELPGAELAHGHDRDPLTGTGLVHGRFEHTVGQFGQGAADRLQRGPAAEILGRDA